MAGRWERWLEEKARRLHQHFLDRLFDGGFDRVRIEPEVVEDICAMAAGSWPKEMIAFLTGSVRKEKGKRDASNESRTARVLVIDGLYVKGYDASTDSTSFTLHDLPMTGVYGTVHSHPGRGNRPSAADRQLFGTHGWFHLIIAQPYTRESIAAYNKHGEPITSIEF